jgi:hypothetical protein
LPMVATKSMPPVSFTAMAQALIFMMECQIQPPREKREYYSKYYAISPMGACFSMSFARKWTFSRVRYGGTRGFRHTRERRCPWR